MKKIISISTFILLISIFINNKIYSNDNYNEIIILQPVISGDATPEDLTPIYFIKDLFIGTLSLNSSLIIESSVLTAEEYFLQNPPETDQPILDSTQSMFENVSSDATLSSHKDKLITGLYFHFSRDNFLTFSLLIYNPQKDIIFSDTLTTSYPPAVQFGEELEKMFESFSDFLFTIPFKIDCNVPEAEVYINSLFIGRTPLINLAADEGGYEVVIYHENYEKLQTTIRVSEVNELFFFTLEPKEIDPVLYNSLISVKIFSFPSIDKYFLTPYGSLLFSFERYFLDYSIFMGTSLSYSLEAGLCDFDRNIQVPLKDNPTESVIETKNVNFIPVTLNLKGHFFRNFQYISPYVNVGLGIGFIGVPAELRNSPVLVYQFRLGAKSDITEDFPIGLFAELFYTGTSKTYIETSITQSEIGSNPQREDDLRINSIGLSWGVYIKM